MAKRLISVWLSLTILLFSSISIYAEQSVNGEFFIRNIYINGEKITNYELDNPAFLYKDAAYLPLTGEMLQILGLEMEMDWESRTLKLLKTDSTRKTLAEPWQKNNLENVSALVLEDVKVVTYEVAAKEPYAMEEELQAASTLDEDVDVAEMVTSIKEVIAIPELTANEVNLGGLPVLKSGEVLYLPASTLANEGNLGWSCHYDSYTGMYISTTEGVTAASQFREPESRYNKGLVNYIRQYNSSFTEAQAQQLVFLFKHEADVYNVDVELLMAIAHKESTFRPSVVSSGGAVGLMQIMPNTAKGYGVSKGQLYDTHTNIELGARIISERLNAYNGNTTTALSAYNQGSGAVSRGSYSTAYANRVMGAQNSLENYLKSNGYGTGN